MRTPASSSLEFLSMAWKIRLGTEERGKDFWDPQPLPVIQWLMGGFGLCRVSPWLAVSRGR